MKLILPSQAQPIPGVSIPRDFFWVLTEPAPLAGMRKPWPGFPWPKIYEAGFSYVVSLHPRGCDVTPLTVLFDEPLQDLADGGYPDDPDGEETRIRKVVSRIGDALRSGRGVVVHCLGGRGRTGTVLGCVLRELGFRGQTIIDFLDRLHRERGKPGWPESPWQSALVRDWKRCDG